MARATFETWFAVKIQWQQLWKQSWFNACHNNLWLGITNLVQHSPVEYTTLCFPSLEQWLRLDSDCIACPPSNSIDSSSFASNHTTVSRLLIILMSSLNIFYVLSPHLSVAQIYPWSIQSFICIFMQIWFSWDLSDLHKINLLFVIFYKSQ